MSVQNTHLSIPLLQRIIQFNFFPSEYMDESWWDTKWSAVSLYTKLKENRQARQKLSEFIIEAYHLESEGYFDFSSATKKVALLDSSNLKRLLILMGLIVESDTIAAVIQRNPQQTIKQSLGEEDYLFALKNRFRFSTSGSNEQAANSEHEFSDYKATVCKSGVHCLADLLQDASSGFIQRVLFKLPKAWSDWYPTSAAGNYQQIATYLPSLFKEVEVPWDVSH